MTQLIPGSIQRQCGYVPCDACSLWARSAGLKVSDQPAGSACSPHVLQCIFQPLQYFSLTKPAVTVFWLLFSDKRTGPIYLYQLITNDNESVCRVHTHRIYNNIGPSNRCSTENIVFYFQTSCLTVHLIQKIYINNIYFVMTYFIIRDTLIMIYLFLLFAQKN